MTVTSRNSDGRVDELFNYFHNWVVYPSVWDGNLIKFQLLLSSQLDGGDYDYTNYDERVDRGSQYGNRRNYNFHGSNKRLRLIWDERGKTLEYTLRVDGSRRGFWISSGSQKGKKREKIVKTGFSLPILIDNYHETSLIISFYLSKQERCWTCPTINSQALCKWWKLLETI